MSDVVSDCTLSLRAYHRSFRNRTPTCMPLVWRGQSETTDSGLKSKKPGSNRVFALKLFASDSELNAPHPKRTASHCQRYTCVRTKNVWSGWACGKPSELIIRQSPDRDLSVRLRPAPLHLGLYHGLSFCTERKRIDKQTPNFDAICSPAAQIR